MSRITTNAQRRALYAPGSQTVGGFTAKVFEYASACPKANRRAVGAAAGVYKDRVLTEAKRDLGGDLVFGNWGKSRNRTNPRPLRLNAGYDVKGYANAVALLKGRPAGPWKVLEYGTRRHPIVAGLTKKQRRVGFLLEQITGQEVDLGTYIAGRSAVTKRKSRKVGGQDRLRKSLALKFSNGNIRYGVMHPGARGKGSWSRGIDKATPGAMATYKAVHARELQRVFTG